VGLVAAGIVAFAVARTEGVETNDKVLAVFLTAVTCAGIIWVYGGARAFIRGLRRTLQRRRVRRQRRRDLARVRKTVGTPRFEDPSEESTVLLASGHEPGWLSRSKMAELMREADYARHRNDFQGAAQMLTDVLDSDPSHYEAHLARGRLYLDLGDYNRAMSDFVAAEDLDPDSPTPPAAIGELYFARKDYVRAIEYFDAVLLLTPDDAEVTMRRGLSHFYRKNYPPAVHDLRRARALDPDLPNIARHLELAERKVKELDKDKPKRRR
jgi:thioredoxin-like negative regulator of GroEL